MGVIKAFTGALKGTFADQWKDIITSSPFDEMTAIAPGIVKQPNKSRGSINKATSSVITNGSKIFVPENTAAFIFSQSGIEDIITDPGGYEYTEGTSSIFSGNGIKESFIDQTIDRFKYGGQTEEQKEIAFINLREIRGIKFGTRSPLMYHDLFYGIDLDITAYGVFSIKIIDPEVFIRNFVPANISYYSFNNNSVKSQIISEFTQSLAVALSSLSTENRISNLPAKSNEIANVIANDTSHVGTWSNRFGFKVVNIGIENIEFSPESKELVRQYSTKQLDWKVLENVSQQSSNIAAQQKISQGIQDHGLGEMPGMAFGMGLVQNINPQNASQTHLDNSNPLSIDEQIETIKKLKLLLDEGILSEEEFNLKKKEILGL